MAEPVHLGSTGPPTLNEVVGVVGAGPIGAGLTHNLVDHGMTVVLHSRSRESAEVAKRSSSAPKQVVVTSTLDEMVQALHEPRMVIAAVSDQGTEGVLSALLDRCSPGDTVLDVSNADAAATGERQRRFARRGISLLAAGLASGSEGAAHGICMTVSGPLEAYEQAERILLLCAHTQDGGARSVGYVGEGAVGHLVKTIHNGLEYSIMQLVAEVVVVLRDLCGKSPEEISRILGSWASRTDSFIVRVGAVTVGSRHSAAGTWLVDIVEDRVDHNGSGARAAVHALEHGSFAPAPALSILARLGSDRGTSDLPRSEKTFKILSLDDAHTAFTQAMSCLYRDSLQHLRDTATNLDDRFDADHVWELWRGATIASTFHSAASLAQCAPATAVESSEAWRRTVAAATTAGVGLPLMSGLLTFTLAQRAPRSYASVLQLMRHQLGGSPYELCNRSQP